jgi:hypothetical protein
VTTTADHMATARGRLRARADYDARAEEYNRRAADYLAQVAKWTERTASTMGQQNAVLASGYGVIPTSGVLEVKLRAPYAHAAVVNLGAAPAIVASSGAGNVPGPGSGAFVVPGLAFNSAPLVGTSLAVYGGVGALVSYSVYARPMPPAACSVAGSSGAPASAGVPFTVPASLTSVTIVTANPGRRGLTLMNDSTSVAQINSNGGNAQTVWGFSLQPGERYEQNPVTANTVTAAWIGAASGQMRVTEST